MTGFVIYKDPELKDDEYILANVKIGEEWMFGFFDGKPAKNARLGKIAYDNMGYEVPGHVPVIVKREI